MEAIRSWAMTVCFAVATAGFISILAPKNQTAKVMKLTVSIFVLLSFLSPISNLQNWEPDFNTEQAMEESKELADKIDKINENYVYQSLSTNIYIMIEEALAELGVEAISIDIQLAINEEPQKIYADIKMDEIYVSAVGAVEKKLSNLGIEAKVNLVQS